MNSDTLIQLLQNGFRISLGATASFVEVLQDPQKRDENLAKLRQEWSQLSEEWAVKGEVTEQEARNFVSTAFNQRSNAAQSSTPNSPYSATTQSAEPDVQTELQELTAQLSVMRAELEKLRNRESN
jgi:polyhydroxyalkanoate synthesis regulator phasin